LDTSDDNRDQDFTLDQDSAEEKVLRARLFRDKLPPEFSDFGSYSVQLFNNAEVPSFVRTACFNLTKQNMEAMYQESRWGWSDGAKLAELNHPLSRYLVATLRPDAADVLRGAPPALAGFLLYRYDLEDLDPPRAEPYIHSSASAELATEAVLYVYELQVRRNGRLPAIRLHAQLICMQTHRPTSGRA
jgi:hypothetical protein